ncbi:MAG: DUF1330 domain-containing protein [Pseudomonadota bacterium]
MKAFFVSTWSVKDQAKFDAYLKKAEASLVPHGGERLLWGKTKEVLEGDFNYDECVVVTFPDIDALNAWHSSETYQSAVPIRREAVHVTLVTYTAE